MQTVNQLATTMEYPGRFLILGSNQENFIAVYGVTARSASSRAKRYVFSKDNKTIHVEPTDSEIMREGNLELLDYTAVHFFENGIIIGNGRQTDLIKKFDSSAVDVLEFYLKDETFEPDKYSTPRITGCILQYNGVWSEALHIIRNDGTGKSRRENFELANRSGNAQFISTYVGLNIRPTPSFSGEPIPLEPLRGTPEQIAQYVYNAFEPLPEKEDLRVGVVVICIDKNTNETTQHIINSVDR